MKKSEKHLEAESKLPSELRPAFNAMVLDYLDASERHTNDGSRRVSYNIVADLIQAGWRKVG